MLRVFVVLIFSLGFLFSATIPVPVVKGDLAIGQIITSFNWVMQNVPDKKVTRFILRDPHQIEGKESRYIKKNGDIFYSNDVMESAIVHNQDRVKVTLINGRIRLSVSGISLKNGALGCTIKVLNPATNRIIDAVVVDSKNVEVRLN